MSKNLGDECSKLNCVKSLLGLVFLGLSLTLVKKIFKYKTIVDMSNGKISFGRGEVVGDIVLFIDFLASKLCL